MLFYSKCLVTFTPCHFYVSYGLLWSVYTKTHNMLQKEPETKMIRSYSFQHHKVE